MATYVYSWYHDFNRFMNESADPRTADWPLIASPAPLIIIIVSYLYFVCKIGPDYMRDRKPYDLKAVITVYNVGQVVACVALFYGILTSGWLDDYSLGCQPVDYSFDPKPYTMAKMIWWTLLLKLSEFLETVFFVLRKKQNQVSNLHLYHHVSTLTVGWLCCKFTPGGMATFSVMANCLVHILMYSYYLIALHGGKDLQRKLIKWKKTLTIIQMVQFTIILTHSLSALNPDCPVPKFLAVIYIPNVLLIYYLFYDFYKKTYTQQKTE